MVSNKFAKKRRVALERILSSDDPCEKDLVWVFGGETTLQRARSGEPITNVMLEVAHSLTSNDWHQNRSRNYANETHLWQARNLPDLKTYPAYYSSW